VLNSPPQIDFNYTRREACSYSYVSSFVHKAREEHAPQENKGEQNISIYLDKIILMINMIDVCPVLTKPEW
jgi:hypothetical protein